MGARIARRFWHPLRRRENRREKSSEWGMLSPITRVINSSKGVCYLIARVLTSSKRWAMLPPVWYAVNRRTWIELNRQLTPSAVGSIYFYKYIPGIYCMCCILLSRSQKYFRAATSTSRNFFVLTLTPHSIHHIIRRIDRREPSLFRINIHLPVPYFTIL